MKIGNQVIKEDKNFKKPLYLINNTYSIRNNKRYIGQTDRIQRIAGIYDKKSTLYQAGSIYNPNGISPTLTKMDRGGNNQPFVLIRKGVKKKYTKAKVGDSINVSYPNNINKRGRVGKEILEDKKHYMRIRKLTPLECWRLMGFDDEDFYKAKNIGISATQLYKQAGNSIVVNVLEEIMRELLLKVTKI